MNKILGFIFCTFFIGCLYFCSCQTPSPINNNNQEKNETTTSPSLLTNENIAVTGVTLLSIAYNHNEIFTKYTSNMWHGLKDIISHYGPSIGAVSKGAAKIVSSGPSNMAVSISNKAELVQRADLIKSILEKRLTLFHSWHNIFTVAKWGVIVASSAQTVKILYELWKYEDMFEKAGEQLIHLHRDYNNLFKELDEMIDILMEMNNLIITEERFTNLEKVKYIASSNSLVDYEIHKDFDNNFVGLTNRFNKVYGKIQNEIQTFHEEVEKLKILINSDKEYFAKRKDESLKTLLVSASCFALSAASILIPPLAPITIASNAGALVSGVMTGINSFNYYYSNKNVQKANYRLQQLISFQKQIGNIRNQSLEYVNHFELNKEKLLNELKKKREEATNNNFSTYTPTQPTTIIIDLNELILRGYEYYKENTLICWYHTLATLFFCGFLYNLFKDGVSFSYRTLTVLIIYCSMMFTLNIAFDMTTKQQEIFSLQSNATDHLVKITKLTYNERYRHECIWYELPIHKQFELEFKSLFWSLVPGYFDYSTQLITRNNSGHLIHHSKCLHYIHVMESENNAITSHIIQTSTFASENDRKQFNNEAQIIGGSYFSFIKELVLQQNYGY
ncbi:hypothetical protein ABK040_001140 [Willaertia magna]